MQIKNEKKIKPVEKVYPIKPKKGKEWPKPKYPKHLGQLIDVYV